MILEEQEKQQILSLMAKYRNLHDGISRIEVSIKDVEQTLRSLYEEKDAIVKGIEENRETETTVIKSLVEKYGEGKLNLDNFEWVTS